MTPDPVQPMTNPLIVAFDDLPTLQGNEMVGDWWRVDPARVKEFNRGSYLDIAYAEHAPMPDVYPENLLEGFYSVSLIDYMLRCLFQVRDDEAYALNYGIDKVRFPRRVTYDDDIRARVTFPEVSRRGEGYLMVYRVDMEMRDGGRPAMAAQARMLFLRRDAEVPERR
jgi:acyl dehydratase